MIDSTQLIQLTSPDYCHIDILYNQKRGRPQDAPSFVSAVPLNEASVGGGSIRAPTFRNGTAHTPLHGRVLRGPRDGV